MIEQICVEDKVSLAVQDVLRYYMLFNYPLKADEIYGNLSVKCSFADLLVAIETMEQQQTIYRYNGYYSLHQDMEGIVEQRKKANQLAATKKRKAMKVGRFIYKFPFVRFVGISGSLSKGYADKKSDFDFFIVTAENRLWISRTILHLYKKATFLLGRQHRYCMNYFIDTDNLQIEEKNRFTATELTSMIPVAGSDTYCELLRNNLWTEQYMPNGYIGFYDTKTLIQDKNGFAKNLFEGIVNRLAPERLNIFFMNLTDRKWRKKWAKKNFPEEEYDMAFKTTIHISKNHPANHQKRVLQALSSLSAKKKTGGII